MATTGMVWDGPGIAGRGRATPGAGRRDGLFRLSGRRDDQGSVARGRREREGGAGGLGRQAWLVATTDVLWAGPGPAVGGGTTVPSARRDAINLAPKRNRSAKNELMVKIKVISRFILLKTKTPK